MRPELPTDLSGLATAGCGSSPGAAELPLVRVVVLQAEGSTPREAGASMLVGAYSTWGTIGGGRLELEAIHHARGLMTDAVAHGSWQREARQFALGPSLGQCCGGHTRLLFEVFGVRELKALELASGAEARGSLAVRPVASGAPITVVNHRKAEVPGCPLPILRVMRDMLSGARPRQAQMVVPARGETAWFIEPAAEERTPLYIYGAGHVGRAIVHVLQGLPFDVRWVDIARDRFPETVLANADAIAAKSPSEIAARAPAGAMHLVLTYSHVLDLAIVHALLQRPDFAYLGLIGSETKAARFRKRLREGGISDAALAQLTCPIGMPGLSGKEPAVIAISVAAQLLERQQALAGQRPVPAEANGA